MSGYKRLQNAKNTLINNGFTEYRKTEFDNDGVVACFQKRYRDENGTKYFINAKIWDFSDTDRVPENYSIEYSGQFYSMNEHQAVNTTFIDWTIKEVEESVEKLFDLKLLDYYEKE